MARIELKGTFRAIEPVQTVGKNNTLKQVIIFETPPYTDEYGDQKGEAEEWKLEILGDQIAKIGLANNCLGKKAKLTVYVNSRKVLIVNKDNQPDNIYPVSLKIAKVEFAEVNQTA